MPTGRTGLRPPFPHVEYSSIAQAGSWPVVAKTTSGQGRQEENSFSQEKSMKPKALRTIVLRNLALVAALGAAWQVSAQDAKAPYPSMAPFDQYLMERNAEIALARSAAPESISQDAEVMVLGRHGYEAAVKGKNGFVCMVERSWSAGIDDPEFWNPKLRAPICLNPPAARSYLPLTIKKTELVLVARSKAQIFDDIHTALDKRELPALESGAMCYMLSKQGYLSDRDRHWPAISELLIGEGASVAKNSGETVSERPSRWRGYWEGIVFRPPGGG
jgi:hypothetical protein